MYGHQISLPRDCKMVWKTHMDRDKKQKCRRFLYEQIVHRLNKIRSFDDLSVPIMPKYQCGFVFLNRQFGMPVNDHPCQELPSEESERYLCIKYPSSVIRFLQKSKNMRALCRSPTQSKVAQHTRISGPDIRTCQLRLLGACRSRQKQSRREFINMRA